MREVLELRQGDTDNERILTIIKANNLPSSMKNVGHILEINEETMLFVNTGKTKDFKGSNTNRKVKYDKELWVGRMNSIRETEKLSFEDARNRLADEFPDENVPKLTWFKENCKEKDGQPEPKEVTATDQENNNN